MESLLILDDKVFSNEHASLLKMVEYGMLFYFIQEKEIDKC